MGISNGCILYLKIKRYEGTMFLLVFLFLTSLADAQEGGTPGQRPELNHSPESAPHLYHGDIKLTPMQRANIERYDNPYGPSTGRAASSQDKTRWPNAVIPYEFDCSIANMESAIKFTKQAMAEWESKTCIRFVKRTTETAYLSFFRGQGCWGHLGHTANYTSQISIGDNCDFQYVMSHEIGHSVGFWHEHNRPDRDNYILVLWENVMDEFHDAFEKRKWGTEVTDYGSQYDFASIMHYPFTAFSKNGRPTIKAIADMQGKTPYIALSADDAMQTNAMYKCNAVMRKRMTDIFYAHFKAAPRIGKRANSCCDKSKNCHNFKSYGYCTHTNHVHSLLYWCPVTCDMCSSDSCMDKSGQCKSWAENGHCQTAVEAMKLDCPYSCGFCGPTTSPTGAVGLKCADKQRECPDWARRGKCSKSGWTFRNCLISCKARCDTAPPKAPGSCGQALGLGWNPTLPDSSFSASTTLKSGGWEAAAHSARLYMEDNHNRRLIGGWCPTSRDNSWLKIDLGREKRLTAIATQGRDVIYGHVERYELEFSRDGGNWTKYPKVFKGNCDHFTPVLNTFQLQVARFIRVLPLGNQSAWPCMRLEVYGCDSVTHRCTSRDPKEYHMTKRCGACDG
ncbi:zinc metalloproteinase nas-13 isoform X2 [Nematostella vectensis]|uniref:zinc metalloproteinase nas-13 isoform X2 n=1 Tax=Nematostella vectensis TaxID=45351 RepID=UPI0020776A33|nr:zinc metalloproteinase nas-13 isoform X2 [Nematostella vectensis]